MRQVLSTTLFRIFDIQAVDDVHMACNEEQRCFREDAR
jgi:hypothetical protein